MRNLTQIHQLIDFFFLNMTNNVSYENYKVCKAIITPKNIAVDKINEIMISKFLGEEIEYNSWDSIIDNNNNIFQEEFLNFLIASGFPPHQIVLKVGCPIMLSRNFGILVETL